MRFLSGVHRAQFDHHSHYSGSLLETSTTTQIFCVPYQVALNCSLLGFFIHFMIFISLLLYQLLLAAFASLPASLLFRI